MLDFLSRVLVFVRAFSRDLALDFLPAFLVDLAAYVAIFTLQHLLDARLVAAGDTSELKIAVLTACYTLTYVAGCMTIGPRTDRAGLRRKSIALGAGLATALTALLLVAAISGRQPPLAVLYAAMLVLGVASAFFWPAFQARVGDRAGREGLGPALRRFNVGWTSGKAFGLFFAGVLYELSKESGVVALAVAVAGFALAFVVQALLDKEPGKGAITESVALVTERPKEEKRGFLVAALVTNFAVWGVQATVLSLVTKLGPELGVDPMWEGVLLGVLVLAQAATFLLLGGSARWRYRRGPLRVVAPLSILAAIAFFLAPSLAWALGAALAAGLLTGASYSASIFYSLDYDEKRGLRMGVNEAALGLGSLLPLAGSALADRTHETRLPYLFVAWVSFAATLVSGWALRPAQVSAKVSA